MYIACLDLEGVLVPEIWIAFAEESGITELKKTTRDEPDYEKLMRYRLDILKQHGYGLAEIQDTIAKIDPFPGALSFLNKLRDMVEAVVVSDTFTQFAKPIIKKLDRPTLLCNELVIGKDNMITDFNMRVKDSKLTTVRSFQAMGLKTIAVGDSFNDLAMLKASSAGFLFRSTEEIISANPEFPAFDDFEDLYEAIRAFMGEA
jgi:phosphoserine/homoserine phosphotransferase